MSEKPTARAKGGIELVAQLAVDAAYDSVMRTWAMAPGDSPIERLFCAALSTLAEQGHRSVQHIWFMKADDELDYLKQCCRTAGEIGSTAFLQSQVQTAGWRVDFVVHFPSGPDGLDRPYSRLLVECDGHDFHERTKEQAARDRSRDRLAQYEGLPIFRFTGSELWRDPWGCADEVLAFVERN